jgi:flagellar basal-body rod modification protein FlgD
MSFNGIDAVSSTSSADSASASGYSSASNEIAKSTAQFMTILLAQLKNQNPMEPMKDSEMMAQMTQLNSLQELQTMNASIEQMAASSSAGYAASLIGKNVKALLSDGSTVSGLATGTLFKNGLYLLTVGSKQIPLSSILEVSAPVTQTTTTTTAAAPVPDGVNNG